MQQPWKCFPRGLPRRQGHKQLPKRRFSQLGEPEVYNQIEAKKLIIDKRAISGKMPHMNLTHIIENSLYFLAIINPASKVLFIASRQPAYSSKELISLCMRSTTTALLILIILTCVGDFLMLKVFHVEIYSLSVAGGIILFLVGLNAVRKGRFIDAGEDADKLRDISIVPLAAPLIAGPGTMTAAISFASINGIGVTSICISIAVIINLFFMLLSLQINRSIEKIHAAEPLIRITGLIVTAVAVQMIFTGCTTWVIKVI
jgi:multiple antibiotic resistance protein